MEAAGHNSNVHNNNNNNNNVDVVNGGKTKHFYDSCISLSYLDDDYVDTTTMTKTTTTTSSPLQKRPATLLASSSLALRGGAVGKCNNKGNNNNDDDEKKNQPLIKGSYHNDESCCTNLYLEDDDDDASAAAAAAPKHSSSPRQLLMNNDPKNLLHQSCESLYLEDDVDFDDDEQYEPPPPLLTVLPRQSASLSPRSPPPAPPLRLLSSTTRSSSAFGGDSVDMQFFVDDDDDDDDSRGNSSGPMMMTCLDDDQNNAGRRAQNPVEQPEKEHDDHDDDDSYDSEYDDTTSMKSSNNQKKDEENVTGDKASGPILPENRSAPKTFPPQDNDKSFSTTEKDDPVELLEDDDSIDDTMSNNYDDVAPTAAVGRKEEDEPDGSSLSSSSSSKQKKGEITRDEYIDRQQQQQQVHPRHHLYQGPPQQQQQQEGETTIYYHDECNDDYDADDDADDDGGDGDFRYDVEDQKSEQQPKKNVRAIKRGYGPDDSYNDDDDNGRKTTTQHGVYYRGRGIGRSILMSVCLAATTFIFLTGFFSAALVAWPRPEKQSVPVAAASGATPTTTAQPTPLPLTFVTPPTTMPTTITITTGPHTPSPAAPTRNIAALERAIHRLIGPNSRAQEMALFWIVERDPRKMAADDPDLAERFLLATLYFTATFWPLSAADHRGHGWLTNATTCQWAGVECDETGHVFHLNLSSVGIFSSIPTELRLLTALRVLDLSHNDFVGTIPDLVPSSTGRRLQQSEGNIFQKNVPSSSLAASVLQVIGLSHNNLNGTIPSSLGRMFGLTAIDLSSNSLSGTIPASIGQLPDLVALDISNNTLEGELPIWRGAALSTIDVSGNDISGNVDETFCTAPLVAQNNVTLVVDCEKVQCDCCHDCAVTQPTDVTTSLPLLSNMDKTTIDDVCGRDGFLEDGGAQCEVECAPLFFECCNPLDGTGTGRRYFDSLLAPRNMTFMDAYDTATPSQCSFETEVASCVKFTKCHAVTQQIDPAPDNLPAICSIERLENDPQECLTLCRSVQCCQSLDSDNCLADHFDACMDHAPCQNLRILDDTDSSVTILPIAPPELESDCSSERPACREVCATASCCAGTGSSSCLQSNFVSCLTYSPCASDTETKTDIPARFSKVPSLPAEAISACSPSKVMIFGKSSCNEYCESVSCCFDAGEANCFHLDPLGCLMWSTLCGPART